MLKEQRKKLPRKGAVKVFEDGREVCDLSTTEGSRIYKARTYEMAYRQGNRCAICGEWMVYRTFDHEAGRGAGKRDDRIEVDGERKNAALCVPCNSLKGSKRYKWIDGKYLPVTREREVA